MRYEGKVADEFFEALVLLLEDFLLSACQSDALARNGWVEMAYSNGTECGRFLNHLKVIW